MRPRASTICGSDVRAIYREHLGTGPEAYQGVVAGHEPCGDVVAVGSGVDRHDVHLDVVVTHRLGIADADEAYRVADSGAAGKVAIVQDAPEPRGDSEGTLR